MNKFTSIDNAIEQAIVQGHMPGAVLGFGQQRKSLYRRAFGHAALIPQSRRMHRETLFDLASLTKVLGATTLAMRLYQRGQLELDRPLGDYLPGHYPADKVSLTPRLLMIHAAGFPPHVPFYRDFPPRPENPALQRRTIFTQVHRTPLIYAPGAESQYSDLGMMLLGELMEMLAGTTLDRLFEAEVAHPLGLRHTFFIHLDTPLAKAQHPAEHFAATEECSWRGDLIRGVVHDENAYLLRGVAGHAGLFSTVDDLQTMATALLAGLAGESSFLEADTLKFFTSQQELIPDVDRALGWGKPAPGASCGRQFSPQAFGHTGFTGTSIWLDPEAERFVILLTNRVHPSRKSTGLIGFRPQLHDLILDAMAHC